MRVLTCACILVLTFTTVGTSEIKYTLTDLGVYDAVESYGINLNENGQVVGWQYDATGNASAFYYSNGQMTNMGNLGGNNSYAFGLNDYGVAVGSSETTNGYLHAMVYQNGQVTDLGTMGKNISEACGINNAGTIVGYTADSNTSYDSWRSFIRENGQMIDLNTLIDPGSGWILNDAWGINEAGQITGQGTLNGVAHAYMYYNGIVTDLGSQGGSAAYGMTINQLGQVVGAAYNPDDQAMAFVWNAVNGMQTLGDFGGTWSTAFSINNLGQIVGEADDAQGGYRAFLYEDDTLIDLNSLIDPQNGWYLQDAEDINDQGQITGIGVINGTPHAFLLTPIPEPATAGLFLLTILGLRRKQF